MLCYQAYTDRPSNIPCIYSDRWFNRTLYVDTESDQQVNICSFAIRCDWRWPSTQCHTSSLSRSVTLFLSPGAQSLQWGYKREGERWGVPEARSAPTGRAKSDRNFIVSLRSQPGGSVVVSYWTNESKGTELGSIGLPSVGGSASPFIDDGDGFTGERERVRMFFSLVAHADED